MVTETRTIALRRHFRAVCACHHGANDKAPDFSPLPAHGPHHGAVGARLLAGRTGLLRALQALFHLLHEGRFCCLGRLPGTVAVPSRRRFVQGHVEVPLHELPRLGERHPHPHVDYFLPSYEEAARLAGRSDPREIAKTFIDHGVSTVAVKLGEEGAFVRTKAGDEFQVPAFQVETVDALGAGDSFVAGFVAGLSKGWDLHRTTRFACAVGAMCVTALGATPGVRSLEETEAFIRQTSTRPS